MWSELMWLLFLMSFFLFNDTATTEIYTYLHTLSLHDALPISSSPVRRCSRPRFGGGSDPPEPRRPRPLPPIPREHGSSSARSRRSEEHTSELQSLMRISYAVFCLTKKQNMYNTKPNR